MYHGYIEIEVRLLRQGHGTDSSGEPGSGYEVEQKKIVRLEERDALYVRAKAEHDGPDFYGHLAGTSQAIKAVLDADEAGELQRRWNDAVGTASPERKRAALAVLEGNETKGV
jgi:hypothetical protein